MDRRSSIDAAGRRISYNQAMRTMMNQVIFGQHRSQSWAVYLVRILLVMVTLAAGACAVAWILDAPSHQAPVTEFSLLDGSSKSTEDFKGKVTLVNFWATSCATCVAEMPDLIAVHQKFQPRGFETVAVAMSYDSPNYVAKFSERRGLPFHIAFDSTGNIAKAWGDVIATPTTFILNRQGEIVKRYVGTPDFGHLHKLIDQLLDEN